jgi:taurine dioxygenase/pentalenolactone F synthase
MYDVTPLEPFGAVVTGLDVRRQPEQSVMERLEHDLDEHHVLVFRGHSAPSDAELVRFVGSFGELERPDVVPDQVSSDAPQIVHISNEVENGAYVGPSQTTRSLDGHSDYCWQDRVSSIGALDAVAVPDLGGETWFSNMYAVFDSLEPGLREWLQRLTAMHVRDTTSSQFREAKPQALRKAEHPLVMIHPTTHRRAIYVNTMYTNRIVELAPDESDELLEGLFLLMSQPEYVYEHRWKIGDLVLWDQLGLVHGRKAFDVNQRRYMRQITTLVADPAAPWAVHA